MADYLTFDTLCDDVCRLIGDLNQARLDEVKSVINQVYLDEMLNVDESRPLFWLRKIDDSIISRVPDTIASISKANPGVMGTTNDTFKSDDIVSLYDIVGMTELNNRMVRLTRTSAKTYTLADIDGTAINTTNYTTYTSGGDVVHRGVASSLYIRRVLKANWHGYNQSLEPINDIDLEESTFWWDENTSRPTAIQHYKSFTNAGIENNAILWFCGANAAYQMRLYYEYRPTLLSATTDVPLLPPQFHGAIEAGAVTRLGENKVQVEAGVIWPQLYMKQLEALRNYNRLLWKDYEQKRGELFLP